jgi:hypothetical protein
MAPRVHLFFPWARAKPLKQSLRRGRISLNPVLAATL